MTATHPNGDPILARTRIGNAPKLVGSCARRERNEVHTYLPIKTMGFLRTDSGQFFVYVGQDKAGGKIKIGMSSNPTRRCEKDFGIALKACIEVTRDSARFVETHALRLLGAKQGDGEWVFCDLSKAVEAIKAARDEVSRFMHADPAMTPEQARQHRIKGTKP